jgi:hypothetical protein
MDVSVNVGLGTGFTQQKIATLVATAGKQQEILQLLGPQNPLVDLGQLRHTFGKILELQGLKDTQNYFKPVPVGYQPPPAPPQQPQKTPEQTLAEAQLQIEQMKTQKDLEIKQAELALKKQEQDRQFQLKVATSATDATIRREQIAAQFKVAITEAQQDQAQFMAQHTLDTQMATVDAATTIRQQAHDEAVAAHDYAAAQSAPVAEPAPGGQENG